MQAMPRVSLYAWACRQRLSSDLAFAIKSDFSQMRCSTCVRVCKREGRICLFGRALQKRSFLRSSRRFKVLETQSKQSGWEKR